ncbi:hypothetical protein, partial [Streptomyces sp. ADI95-17]|uniref:hypothetical protein n=1 Tax=Streptomyces sp. ADI95-17 TaxID=1522759 RepID=UPI0013DE6F73
MALRMTLVAFVAAVGFVLAGPATDASAAPPPPDPTASSPANQPSWWNKLPWNLYGWAQRPLDPHDPYYQAKLPVQHFVKWQFKRAATGGTTFSPRTDGPDIAETLINYHRESRQTVKGLTKQLTKAEKKVQQGKKRVAAAKTPAELEQAKQKLRKWDKQHKYVSDKLRDLKKTQPKTTGTQVERLDKQVRKLEKKIRKLQRRATSPQQTRTKDGRALAKQQIKDGRALAKQQIHDARTALAQARAERDRLRGPDDEGDTGGTRATTTGPKTPSKGPTTNGMKMPKESVVSSVKPPKLGPKFGLKMPRWGRGQGTGLSETLGDLAGQAYADQVNSEHEQLLKKAVEDDTLRKAIVDDYHQIQDDTPLDSLGRGFDTSKGFTQGATRDIGPKLIKHQEMLDTTKAVAD